MPLLLDFLTTRPEEEENRVAEDLESVERLRESVEAQRAELAAIASRAIKRVIGLIRLDVELWQLVCVEIAKGGPAAATRFKALLLNSARTGETIARRALETAHRDFGPDWPFAKELREAISLAERFSAAMSRWKTDEDLEELAAEWYPLPESKLAAVRKKFPAPPEWYAEDVKPDAP